MTRRSALKKRKLQSGPLVCDSRCSVFLDIYGSASDESAFFDQILHDSIIRMRIHPDVSGESFTILHRTQKQAVHLTIPGEPVDRDVRLVIQPAPVLNAGIIRLCALKQRKHPVYSGFIIQHSASLLRNIRSDLLGIRIGMPPLRRVSGTDHIVLCVAVDPHDLFKIGTIGVSYLQHTASPRLSTHIR